MIFQYYDRSGDGRIDYKEFSQIIQSGDGAQKQTPAQAVREYRQQQAAVETGGARQSRNVGSNDLIKLFRDKIKARGARGMVGIQRLFKIMDDDGSKTLSEQEFSKACRDFKTGISEENIPTLFSAFDTNRDGTLNIDEFLMAIRGELNDKRLALVRQAFNKIDIDGSGYLEVNDIKDSYRADKHPDVIEGKRTEEAVLIEFLETFEAHLNLRDNTETDGRVSMDEFVEYYKNISASIDNDDYFALMMNNSWNLRGDASPYTKYEKGWANEEAKSAPARPKVQYRQPQAKVQRSGQMSNGNPL